MRKTLFIALNFALLFASAGLSAPSAAASIEGAAVDAAAGRASEGPRDEVVNALFLIVNERARGFSEAEQWTIAETVHDAARLEGVDPYLVLAVIGTESSFRRRQQSSVGAMGLMQLRPSTAKAFAKRAGVRWRGHKTLWDPANNIRIGTAYLAHLLRRFDGKAHWALTSYCHGPTRTVRHLRANKHRLSPDYIRYSRKVHRLWRQLAGAKLGPALVG